MGWSESYYRDYLVQNCSEWRKRMRDFLESADRLFAELHEAEAPCRIQQGRIEECRRLWDELRGKLAESFFQGRETALPGTAGED